VPIAFKKGQAFFSILETQAKAAFEAASQFLEMVNNFDRMEEYVKKIDDIEHEADQMTRSLMDMMDSTFITPLDKEDLRDLSHALDDITDCIEAASARAHLYKLKTLREDLRPLAELLVNAAKSTWDAVGELKNGFKSADSMREILIHIHVTENESDRAFRAALADLFEEPNADPLMVIKWKEIYDRVEVSVDKCEDVAKVLGRVLTKYA
jgi:predicted phosphate transport protein (TIGR00153 family)